MIEHKNVAFYIESFAATSLQVWFHFFNAQRKRCRQANALSEFFAVALNPELGEIVKPELSLPFFRTKISIIIGQ